MSRETFGVGYCTGCREEVEATYQSSKDGSYGHETVGRDPRTGEAVRELCGPIQYFTRYPGESEGAGSEVERLLDEALGSLTFALANIKRDLDGNAIRHIEDARREIRAAADRAAFRQGVDEGTMCEVCFDQQATLCEVCASARAFTFRAALPEGAVPVDEVDGLRRAVAFLRSCVLSGEVPTDETIDGVLLGTYQGTPTEERDK